MKITCPQCGGETRVETPDPFVICAFCHGSLYIDLETITPVFTFSPEIESNRVSLYLKKDFEKVGLGERLAIREVAPVYLPFWRTAGQNLLQRASAAFPAERIPLPSAGSIFFDPAVPEHERPPLLGIDLPPAERDKPLLYLVPFYELRVCFREQTRRFFVNAVNGGVYGEPLPVFRSGGTRRLFFVFISFLLSLLAVNFLFDRFIVAVFSNLLVLGIFYLLFDPPPVMAAKRR